MSTEHSPTIRLAAAQRAFDVASTHCPHWDYESGSGEHQCCHELYDAGRELSLARKAFKQSEQGK